MKEEEPWLIFDRSEHRGNVANLWSNARKDALAGSLPRLYKHVLNLSSEGIAATGGSLERELKPILRESILYK